VISCKGDKQLAVQFAAVVLYAKDLETTIEFYKKHFGFNDLRHHGDRIVELVNEAGGGRIMVHQAARAVRQGQAAVKLVFAIEDVAGFCAARATEGLEFGQVHHADGYVYANARDPSGNPISVSSRAFHTKSAG
jgi:catechol 2,3-dioxygenase-like lactoylglutathione lyase family enzyme